MNDNKGQAIFLSVIGIATLLVAIIGATFAYFTTTMNGTAADVNATTAKLGSVSYQANGITASEAVLPGWSESDTITLTMQPSDVDVDFNCFVNASALGTDDKALTNFYVTSSATASGSNTIADTISSMRKFTEVDKGQKVKIASGTLKGGNTADNVQTINYTIGFAETGEEQDEQGLAFAAAVTCELKSDQTVYFNNDNKTGTTTKPNANPATPGE